MKQPARLDEASKDLDGIDTVLREIEHAVGHAVQVPALRARLVSGFRAAFGSRQALLERPAQHGLVLSSDDVEVVLAERGLSLRAEGDTYAALGFAYVALVMRLARYGRDHPQRERLDHLSGRAAGLLDQVGRQVADTVGIVRKVPNPSTTPH